MKSSILPATPKPFLSYPPSSSSSPATKEKKKKQALQFVLPQAGSRLASSSSSLLLHLHILPPATPEKRKKKKKKKTHILYLRRGRNTCVKRVGAERCGVLGSGRSPGRGRASLGWGRATRVVAAGGGGGWGGFTFIPFFFFFPLLPSWVCRGSQWGRYSSWISDLGFTGVGVFIQLFFFFFFWVAGEEDEDGGEKMKVLGFGGCGEKRGFHFFFNFFLFLKYIYLEDLGFFFKKKKYYFATWHTFGYMAQMWQPRQHLTDQWMENVTVV